MIIIIDIAIIMIITILSIYNSFNKQLINEILRLTSLVLAIFLTNLTSINVELNKVITNNTKSILDIDRIFNFEIFNAISFLLVAATFYSMILYLGKLSKNQIKDFSKNEYDFFQKLIIVVFSTFRMVLILSLLMYGLESSIFNSTSVKEIIHTSPSLKAFSSFSQSIVIN
tara:strand:- start:1981 stop:2493 length:513 start_codon:yes stop_codon:yes gene_type:complete